MDTDTKLTMTEKQCDDSNIVRIMDWKPKREDMIVDHDGKIFLLQFDKLFRSLLIPLKCITDSLSKKVLMKNSLK